MTRAAFSCTYSGHNHRPPALLPVVSSMVAKLVGESPHVDHDTRLDILPRSCPLSARQIGSASFLISRRPLDRNRFPPTVIPSRREFHGSSEAAFRRKIAKAETARITFSVQLHNSHAWPSRRGIPPSQPENDDLKPNFCVYRGEQHHAECRTHRRLDGADGLGLRICLPA